MILQRLKESLYFWRRHLAALFLVSAPFTLLGEALQWLLGPVIVNGADGKVVGFNALSMALLLLIRPLAEGALIVQLASIQHGRPRGLLACVLPALARFPFLLATYFMMALAVSVGWMLLFFPALWIYARLCFSPFRLLLRNEGPLQSLQSAFERSSACQWPLLLNLVLSGLLVFALAAVVNSLVIGLLGENAGTLLVTGLITGLLATLVNVVAFRFWTLADEPPAAPARD
ncbi:hypothetical protein [Alloalcanivorax marinus]|uniref:hypothetical protein n=1 Tax=Alloalcanivorax marinus TaxID=1177169 RepID=UPI0019338FD9|nr:hypothetical protein [Alloalcanivorax marinus]MBL7250669.1 hypothetical protein [Alloalcanivorax marinus]